ncbi:MAG: ATP-binding protein [Alkalispirochaeta sp.]
MNTDAALSLGPSVERLITTLERLVLEESSAPVEVHDQLREVREEARFLHADEVCDAIDHVTVGLEELEKSGAVEPGAVLPLVFRLRDAAGTLHADREPSEASAPRASFLEVDLQDEISAVLSISEETERSLNSRMQLGQTPFLLVLRVDPAWLDTLEEFLESEYQVLSYRRQDSTARIAAVVVEVVAPEVERAVDATFGDRSIIKEAAVRPLDREALTVERGAINRWYAELSPIAVEIEPAAMERIWLLMDVLAPSGTERIEPALWRELRKSIASSFTVELRDVLTDMRESLENMAVTAGKKIRLSVSGRGAAIGVEIAEPLRNVLFELISNSIVHGIESPSDRQAQNKPEIGSISCYIQKEGQSLSVRITDDGGGFEHETLQSPQTGGLQRVRDIVQDRLGGVLRVRSGRSGATAIVELPALQGVYRGLVVVRNDVRIVVPSALVVWAGEVSNSRIVVDTTGSCFLRYQRQLIPLVEPEYRLPPQKRSNERLESDVPQAERDEVEMPGVDHDVPEDHVVRPVEQTSSSSPSHATAAVVIGVAGDTVALAVDAVQNEMVVSTSPQGSLRLSLSDDGSEGTGEWAVAIALQNLPLGQ